MRIWGNPVEYKGINIYPIRMKDCTAFYENVSCLMYEKNKIQDVRVIKMSYLDFLFALIQQEEEIFKRLEWILNVTLRDQKYEFRYFDDGSISLFVENIFINGFEFENIKKIILDENMIKSSDEIFESELEKSLQEAEDFKASREGTPATLEERVIAYHCVSGIDYSVISEYTIFQFNKGLERFALIKNYEVYTALLAENGASSDIQHWLCHIEEKGKYADVIMSKEDFDKLSSENGLVDKA